MRHARWLCLLLLASAATLLSAADIQISCEPGLRVYLDGAFVGTSNAREDGLALTGVPEGAHTIRVEKPGFMPQGFQVVVTSEPIEIRVATFDAVLEPGAAPPPATKTADRQVGNLVVTSAPQQCSVEIDGASQRKDTPYLDVGPLAPGKHTVAFSKEGFAPISTVVTMQPGAEITVRGDLKNGIVEVSHDGKGSLRIVSRPERCTIRLLGATREKTGARLNISYLPAGEHRMFVSCKGVEQSTNVLITNGHRTVVTVNFMGSAVPFRFAYEPE